MLKKTLKRVLSLMLTGSMLASVGVGATGTSVNKTQNDLSLEEIIGRLSELSDDQIPEGAKASSEELFISGAQKISPDVNLKTSDNVKIIVEFVSEPKALQKGQVLLSDKVDDDYEDFLNFLDKEMGNTVARNGQKMYKVTNRYEYAFNGISMEVPGDKVESLLKSPNVKKIWNNYEISIEKPIVESNLYGENEGTLAKQYDAKEIENDVDSSEKERNRFGETLDYLGVTELHKQGVTGKGVTVGIIDTGVDYNHPDLRDLFFNEDGTRREYIGYDSIDEDFDPMETTYEDWQNSGMPEIGGNFNTYYTSHGTHVAGTISGQAKNTEGLNVLGIAPDANVYMYRSLGAYGQGELADILQSMDLATRDEVDVLNMSLGIGVNDPLWPTSVAANNASLAGISVVVAAGNAGYPYSVGSPGAAPLVITVGSTTPTYEQRLYKTNYTDGTTNVDLDLKLLAKGMDNKSETLENQEFTLTMPAGPQDYTGKILVFPVYDLGNIGEKLKMLKESWGVENVIVYNKEDKDYDYIGEAAYVPTTFYVTGEQGRQLEELIRSSSEVKMNMGEKATYKVEGDQMSVFSSRGPVEDTQDIKPDLTGPGDGIYSTYPEYINDKNSETTNYDLAYSRISGTSMATPHIAAISALILQQNPSYEPHDVKVALMNSTEAVKGNISIYDEGAGRVDALEAVYRDTRINVKDTVKHIPTVMPGGEVETIDHYTGSMRFEYVYQGSKERPTKEVKIENNSSETKTYSVSMEFNHNNNTSNAVGVRDGVKNGIGIDIPSTIEIGSGETKTLEVKPIIPENAETGVYEGFVNFVNGEDVVRVPFTIRYEKEGLRFNVINNVMRSLPLNEADNPLIEGTVFLTERFKLTDIILLDPATNRPIGLIMRSTDIASFSAGRSIDVAIPVQGYYKFTGDNEKPLEYMKTRLQDGHYKLAIVGIAESGKVYMDSSEIYIDNIAPQLTVNHEAGIFELKDEDFKEVEFFGTKVLGYEITGKVYDEATAEMIEKGMSVSQGDNRVAMFYNGSFAHQSEIDKEGNFRAVIYKDHFRYGKIELRLEGIDAAQGPGRFSENMIFIREGETLYTLDFDKGQVSKNERFTAKLAGRNLSDVEEIKFEIPGSANSTMYDDTARGSEELLAYAAEHNADVKVTTRRDKYNLLEVTVRLENKDTKEIIPINGVMNILDLDMSLSQGTLLGRFPVIVTEKKDGVDQETDSASGLKYTECVDNATFNLSLDIMMMGYMFGDSSRYKYDSEGKPIIAKIIHDDGTEVIGVQDENSQGKKYIFKDLDGTKGLRLVVSAPGHLDYDRVIDPFRKDADGNDVIEDCYYYITLGQGDINDDEIVDMRDFLMVYEKLGINDVNLPEDINGDGLVNKVDLGLVVATMGQIAGEPTEEPIMEIEGKIYKDYLRETEKTEQLFVGITTGNQTFTPGGFIQFETQAIHARMASFELPLVIAQYDIDGNLIKYEYKWHTMLFGGDKYKTNLKTEKNAATVKVFPWSGLDVLEKAVIFTSNK